MSENTPFDPSAGGSSGSPSSPRGPAGGQRPSPRPQRHKMSPLSMVLMLSGAFFIVFLFLSGVMFMYRGSGAARGGAPSAFFGGGTVGVIELKGVIMDSKKIIRRLHAFEDDPEIRAVVLRLNSPGGAVAPSQEIYQVVKNYKKPIIASMSSVAASGAYYVACGARKIFANPGTLTGSIGVIMEFADLEKLYEWAKIKRYVIKTGKFKDVGSEFRAMSPEERTLLQNLINDVLLQFKKAVATGRKLTLAQVTALADGRIFSGSQAKAVKLVDELGTLQDAINEAGKMAQIKGKPRVVYPQPERKKWWDFVLDNDRDNSDSSSESAAPAGGVVGLIRRVLEGLGEGFGAQVRPSFGWNGAPGIYWLWTGGN